MNLDNKTPVNSVIEKMAQSFKQYKDFGLPRRVFDNLTKSFLDERLKPYQETFNEIDYPRITNEGNDETFLTKKEVIDFIDQKFQGSLLQKALVSGIELRMDEIRLQAPSKNSFKLEQGAYYIPKEKFTEHFNQLSPVQQKQFSEHIYHAESYASWNREEDKDDVMGVGTMLLDSGHVFPTPVALFNMELDEETKAIQEDRLADVGLEYLSHIEESERLKVYALGTIAHEAAHNIFQHLLHGKSYEKEWEEVVNKNGSITKYADEYKDEGLTYYDENFAEAVRLFTTTKQYLNEINYSEAISFIEKYFPEIQS